MIMSYMPEVQTDNTGKWYGNHLRFETELEALFYVKDLANRWYMVREYRVIPCDETPNYKLIDNKLVEIGV
jgi:hypothetical protein